jgi:hypothetical protein
MGRLVVDLFARPDWINSENGAQKPDELQAAIEEMSRMRVS